MGSLTEDRFESFIKRWLTPTVMAALITVAVYSIRTMERVVVIQEGILLTQQQIISRMTRNEGWIIENKQYEP